MNLVKNVDGEWVRAREHVRQDLDTIQRTVNQLQATLAALTTQVNTPVAKAPATIRPDGRVITHTGDYLTSVAAIGALTGNGTPSNPLNVSALTLAAAGALTGAGTAASPLSVSVDGSTVTINGSNKLVASVSGGMSHVTTGNIASSIPTGATVTAIAAPGVGLIVIPVWAVAQAKYGGYTTGVTLKLRYAGNANDEMLLSNVISGGGVASTGHWAYSAIGGTTYFDRVIGTIDNKAINIVFSNANSAVTAGDILTVDIWYVTYSLTI